MKKTLSILCLLLVPAWAGAQINPKNQYFDGSDTAAANSLLIEIDTAAGNLWQVGPPGKALFGTAFSQPNVLVTDTLNNCPANNISRFYFRYAPLGSIHILALRWAQKLDMEPGREGALIEYSTDKGSTWQNIFDNPYVYNFYGFDTANAGVLPDGSKCFTGRDTAWKDIWLCFQTPWISSVTDTLWMRYSLVTDSVAHGREGWMIDNLMSHITIFHTAIKKVGQESYFDIYPNPADDRVYLRGANNNGFHVIEEMQLVDITGKVVKQWGVTPVKFYFDTSDLLSGMYVLRIRTNLRQVSYPLVIRHTLSH